jgi:hypothetical protein
VLAEVFLGQADVVAVKRMVVAGLALLVPAIALAGVTGSILGAGRPGRLVAEKKRRMPWIALNGLLVLVPAALFLRSKAVAGEFDAMFVAVQVLELLVGAVNLWVIARNMRDGLALSGAAARRYKLRRAVD